MSEILPVQCPWLGPRPFEEKDYKVFFGRGKETEAIVAMILRERLSVIAGLSGAGKTSLLRAGVLPALRTLRRVGKEVPPVLVLREWKGGTGSADGLFRAALRAALREKPPTALAPESDPFEGLEGKLAGEAFLHDVDEMSAELGEVILVFDQFEEVLRFGRRDARDAINLLLALHNSPLPVRIVISLREEHLRELRPLEKAVRGFHGRSFVLAHMAAPVAIDAMLASADAEGVELPRDQMHRLVEWLQKAEARDGLSPREENSEGVDLLTLQTLLLEIHQFARTHPLGNGGRRLDHALIEAFRDGRDPPAIVSTALQRWIGDSLTLASSDAAAERLQALLGGEGSLAGLVRRVSSRMAPFLSTGGYKVPHPERSLAWGALEDDLTSLRIRRKEFEEWYPDAGEDRPAPRGWTPPRGRLAGPALLPNFPAGHAPLALARVFQEAVRRLKDRNVMKRVQTLEDGQDVIELVHDGLGTPFQQWGERHRGRWRDAAHSLAAVRGKDLHPGGMQGTRGAPLVIERANWKGCAFDGSHGDALRHVVFRDCDLSGSIFTACALEDIVFERCVLNGTVFQECRFSGEAGVVIQECREGGGLAVIGGSIARMEVRRSTLLHFSLIATRIEGSLGFRTSRLSSSIFRTVGGDGALHFDEGCGGQYNSWDLASETRLVQMRSDPARWTSCGRSDAEAP